MPTCAVNQDDGACTHDRFEPNWFNLTEETGNAGPFHFCCIAYRADELPQVDTDTLWLHLDGVREGLRWHSEQAQQRTPNACELLHIANYAYDQAKLESELRSRGEDPSTLTAALTRMGCGPR